jgi:hypothetical protein
MSASELIVPVEVHALEVNEKVRETGSFYRVQPSFSRMLAVNGVEVRGSAEEEPFDGVNDLTPEDDGVFVQWQLPEALTDGVVDPVTDETCYPLVPNRWLVVRYAQIPGRTTKPKGWIVHSDWLYSQDPDLWDGREGALNEFLNPHAQVPEVDWIGRRYDLDEGPWNEEGIQGTELFLTAVGPGLPLFAAYEPYQESIFSLHDDLKDFIAEASYPPDATLSYLVVGWYSDSAKDILHTAADIPGLLPPDSDGSIADVIAALGWSPAPAPVAISTIPGHSSSTVGAGPVECILDGDPDTWYETGDREAPKVRAGDHVTVDLGVAHRITEVAVTFGRPEDGSRMAPAKGLLASADGAEWSHLGTATEIEPDILWFSGPDELVLARYLRVEWTEECADTTVVRTLTYKATPTADGIDRSVFAGTVLGLDWQYHDHLPEPGYPREPPKIAAGHSVGEAVTAMVDWQRRSVADAQLFSALYHGTLDTFDGAEGEKDLAEITQRAWYSGSEGGVRWRIEPRPDVEKDSEAGPDDLTPPWLNRLNAQQDAYAAVSAEVSDRQWHLWALHWLRNLPGERPPGLPPTFDEDCDYQLKEENPDSLAAATRAHLDRLEGFFTDPDDPLPRIPPDHPDPQDVIDAFAADKGLPEHLRLHRGPGESFYKPADPVLLIEGAAGAVRPLTRDSDNPLPCRTEERLLAAVEIGEQWVERPQDPPDPGTEGLPDPAAALLAEFALLHQAAHTELPDGTTALDAIVADPARARGHLAEYTALWRQPWLPLTLMWMINWFPTPYHTGDDASGTGRYDWTFQAPSTDESGPYRYVWNEEATAPPADYSGSEGNVLNRLFRSRSYLAPTTVYVVREQLARYLATYPAVDRDTRVGLAELRRSMEEFDFLSQSLEGFNDWLLQQDGRAQVPTEPAVAGLTDDQGYVPDGAIADHTDRFDPVRAGRFAFTDLCIVDRFGQIFPLVTSGDGGSAYKQYPIRTDSVAPNRALYGDKPGEPELINPERFIQLPPRLLQDTRLAHVLTPASPATAGGSPIAGWLLVNYLDQTLGVYGPVGQALGELRLIHTTARDRDLVYTPLPHAPYADENDERFDRDHPHLVGFLLGLLDPDNDPEYRVTAFEALLATINKSHRHRVDRVPHDDQLPARLIGRPVALIRTDLTVQLQGPPLTDPSMATILDPPEPDYPDHTWPIRLGDPYDLLDGLIGYYTSEPDQDIDYSQLHAVNPDTDHAYTPAIGNGADLALPARPDSRRTTRHLTLLAHPHLPVHATTGILPVHAVHLDADLVHDALARIRACFRLSPLLATTRSDRTVTSSITGHATSTPQAGPVECILDGDPDTWYQSGDREPPKVGIGDHVTVDLGSLQQVTVVRALLGEPGGARTAPAKKLRFSADGDQWTNLSEPSEAAEITWPVSGGAAQPPISARYLRLEMTAESNYTTVVRSMEITCDPDDHAVVVPPLSARFGTWTWAQPVTSQNRPEVPDWQDHPLIPADQLTHPDDAIPTARAGYLVLQPPTPDVQP